MVVQVLLIIAITLLLIASIGGISLIKETKYNVIWIMVVVALLSLAVLAALRFILSSRLVSEVASPGIALACTWLTFAVSIFLCVGVYYARKLVMYIDRINFQKQLTNKRILSTVLRTEEKERIRFSKELHDGLGPLLSSAKMSLSVIDKTKLSDSDREILSGTTQVIEEAVRSLREISNNLSPHVLNEFGLDKGISNFAAKIATINKVAIEYKSTIGSRRFDTDIEVILYRVVCELVGNSLRHSGCSRIGITLNATGETITMEYFDNGRGFCPATTYSGMGLSNISSRVGSLNGTLDLDSSPGNGMTAVVRINLQ